MKPLLVRSKNIDLRQLSEGSQLKIYFDNVNGAQNFSLGWVSIEPMGKTSIHTRDVEEIIICLKGQVLVVTKAEEFVLNPGDSILIPPGIEHCHENRSNETIEQLYFFTPQGPEKPLRDLPIVKS